MNNLALPPQLSSLFSQRLQHELRALRRDLHQHPELSLQEHRTAARLYAELEKLRPLELTRVAGTGVIARHFGATSSNFTSPTSL